MIWDEHSTVNLFKYIKSYSPEAYNVVHLSSYFSLSNSDYSLVDFIYTSIGFIEFHRISYLQKKLILYRYETFMRLLWNLLKYTYYTHLAWPMLSLTSSFLQSICFNALCACDNLHHAVYFCNFFESFFVFRSLFTTTFYIYFFSSTRS